jgi:hypothetical protein
MCFANVPSRDFCKEKDCIQEERMAREQINLGIKLKDGLPYTEWSKEQMKMRRANGGREDPHTYCMPPNFPRAWTLPQHSRIVQTPGMMVVLHEFNGAYREVYLATAARQPESDVERLSTGRWEGDTLIIETNGIRDDMWLDIQGSPITESAHLTERLKRLNLGLMQVEIAVDDPKAYTKPWSVTIEMAVQVDTQMLGEICIDNERTPGSIKMTSRLARLATVVACFCWRQPGPIIPNQIDLRESEVEGTVTKVEWRSPRLDLRGCDRRQRRNGELELRAAESSNVDAAGMDPRLGEAR